MALVANIPLIVEHIIGFIEYEYLIKLAAVSSIFRGVCRQRYKGITTVQREDVRLMTFRRNELKRTDFMDHCKKGHLVVARWLTKSIVSILRKLKLMIIGLFDRPVNMVIWLSLNG